MVQLRDLSPAHQEAFTTLQTAIEWAESETFTLLFACCDDRALRPELTQQFQTQTQFKVREIYLEPDVWLAYETLKRELGNEHPQVLFVDGLDTAKDVIAALRDWNAARNSFMRDFRFPVVIWLDRPVQRQLLRVAKDLESWGTYVDFDEG
ncbi:MAG: hypothetical protein F6J87_10795 [Spirulina sp. SIO3F2]|nr:hypothetical protein [Spirulina sp. SIO3F2]